jgi:hypothetical protein
VAGKGRFGAALMLDRDFPRTLGRIRASLPAALPLTLKCRIGVDEYALFLCGMRFRTSDSLVSLQASVVLRV